MKNLIHKKIKYISIIIGLLGLIPYGLPLIEKYDLIDFIEIKTIDLTIWYGITILCFLSGIYWGFSINALIKNNSKLNYLLPALSIIPFMFAVGAVIVTDYLNIIFLVIGFLICQILDEILFAQKFHFNWYILLRRFLTLVVVTSMIYYYIDLRNA
tara:strand:+ start:674 stop:1141 length:468 start_codon:yes stop_codon:yes gene_type:complete